MARPARHGFHERHPLESWATLPHPLNRLLCLRAKATPHANEHAPACIRSGPTGTCSWVTLLRRGAHPARSSKARHSRRWNTPERSEPLAQRSRESWLREARHIVMEHPIGTTATEVPPLRGYHDRRARGLHRIATHPPNGLGDASTDSWLS